MPVSICSDVSKAELFDTVAHYYAIYCANTNQCAPDEWHVKWWVERIYDPTQTLYTIDYMKQVFVNHSNLTHQVLLKS